MTCTGFESGAGGDVRSESENFKQHLNQDWWEAKERVVILLSRGGGSTTLVVHHLTKLTDVEVQNMFYDWYIFTLYCLLAATPQEASSGTINVWLKKNNTILCNVT